MKRIKRIYLLVGILLLAFALRVVGLADHNIWWDEGIGVWLARMPVLESIRWTAGDVHPPLYYMLLRGWWRLVSAFPEGREFVLRFPSVLFSFLAVPLIFRLGKAVGSDRRSAVGGQQSSEWVTLLAALFLALSRFAIVWAQEIRMYALSAMFATGALWAAVWMWRDGPQSRGEPRLRGEPRPRGRWRAWLTYVVMTLGSLYTLYLTITVPTVANLGFLVVWWQRGRPRRMLWTWLSAQITVGVLFLPWLAYALPQMHSWASDSAFSLGSFVQLYATMLAVGSPLNLEAYLPLTVAVFAVLAVGVAMIWRKRGTPAQSGALAMLLAGLVLPAAVVALVSLPVLRFYFSRPLVPRYLLPLSACFYTLLAWSITALVAAPSCPLKADRSRFPRLLSTVYRLLPSLAATLLVIVTAASGLRSFYPDRARRDDYASIALTLKAYRQPNDAVLLYVDRDWPIFVAHYAGDRESVPYGATLDATATDALLAPIWDTVDGFWLVTTPEALQTDPQQIVPAWLAEYAVAQQTWITGENALTFYARTGARAASLDTLAPDFTPPANVAAQVNGGTLLGATLPQSRYRTGDTARLALYWSSLPTQDVMLRLEGPETREIAIVAPENAQDVTRQRVDIPLPPDLPGGRYRFVVQSAEGHDIEVEYFTLVRRAAGASVSEADIQYRVDYQLGESIHLIGYDLPQTVVEPGDVIPLTLYWQTTDALPARYKVFTHLLGEVYNAASDNFLWGQQDNEPGSGQALTTLWSPGAVIVDTYSIPVDPAAPPGTYTIELGMYGLVDVARLPVFGAGGTPQGDAILLTQIEVQTP